MRRAATRADAVIPGLFLFAAVIGAAACSSTSTRSPRADASAAAGPADRAQTRFVDWEALTRAEADRLMDKAHARAAEGLPSEAAACADQALTLVLSLPPGYRVRPAYLEYAAALMEDSAGFDVEPEIAPGGDEDLTEVPLPTAPEEALAVEAEVEEEPPETIPSSDIPIILNGPVQHFLEAFTGNGEFRRRMEVGLNRASRYLPMIRAHLRSKGLPLDIAYLPLIESAFSNRARSRARAVGMWQFIASTGRLYGLSISPLLDERRDPEEATRAAVAHLDDLYNRFGDWYLALAAYNSGSGNVRRAIRRSGSRDFWRLRRFLPRETRNYVPAFLASIIVAKDPQRYGLEPPAEEAWSYDRIAVPDAMDLQFLARKLELPLTVLRELNPAVRRDLTPARRTTALRLPAGSAAKAAEVLASVPRAKWAPRLVHSVSRGESLYVIARRYGSSVRAIRQANGLRHNLIHPGQTLIVPRFGVPSSNRRHQSRRVVAKGSRYTVRAADTLWDISRSFGVSVGRLRRANGLGRRSLIRPGDRLVIPSGRQGGHSAPLRSASLHRTYKVRRGDTLYGIARRFGTSVTAIRRANGLSGSRIHPGDVLRIPSAEARG